MSRPREEIDQDLAEATALLQAAEVNQRRLQRQANLSTEEIAQYRARRDGLLRERLALDPGLKVAPAMHTEPPAPRRVVTADELEYVKQRLKGARYAESCQGGRRGTREAVAYWRQMLDGLTAQAGPAS